MKLVAKTIARLCGLCYLIAGIAIPGYYGGGMIINATHWVDVVMGVFMIVAFGIVSALFALSVVEKI